MSCGLYEELVADGLLVSHDEVAPEDAPPGWDRVIHPEEIPFVSYPYEWCFSQLKDAALATLEIEKRALRRGLTLIDASAYNIQFLRGRPVLIDTLSLRLYEEGEPWTAYRQFCQHFLAPLALMSLRDVRLASLARVHIDGIPLDLASSLLPFRSRLRPSLLLRLHLHARSQKRYEGRPRSASPEAVSVSAPSSDSSILWSPGRDGSDGGLPARNGPTTTTTRTTLRTRSRTSVRSSRSSSPPSGPKSYGTWAATLEPSAGPPRPPAPRSCHSTLIRPASKGTTSASGTRGRAPPPPPHGPGNPSSPSAGRTPERFPSSSGAPPTPSSPSLSSTTSPSATTCL